MAQDAFRRGGCGKYCPNRRTAPGQCTAPAAPMPPLQLWAWPARLGSRITGSPASSRARAPNLPACPLRGEAPLSARPDARSCRAPMPAAVPISPSARAMRAPGGESQQAGHAIGIDADVPPCLFNAVGRPAAARSLGQGTGARLKYSARPSRARTALTQLGSKNSSKLPIGATAVAMSIPPGSNAAATRAMTSGGINGSSPCWLTTTSSAANPRSRTTSAIRSVPTRVRSRSSHSRRQTARPPVECVHRRSLC